MKAIKITQDIKDKNARYNISFVETNAVGTIVKRGFPSKFYVTEPVSGGYANRTDLHDADGWQDVIIPSYNSSTQKLGSTVIEVEGVFTYEVIDKTEQEIQNQIISKSESNKQQLIQQKLEQQVINEAQSGDDTTALDNQDLFPIWETPFDYTVDFKCQAFNNENELKLYKCVQAHTSQSDWQPKDVPALFTVVAYPNEIPVWVQPTGTQDAYNIGDQVKFPTANDETYESLIDANVWSPIAHPAGWQQL